MKTEECENCDGTGYIPVFGAGKKVVDIKLCRKCKGRGRVDTGGYVVDDGGIKWK